MKLFAVMGSPHQTGNTAMLLEHVLAGARSVGIQTSRADLYPLHLEPCLGCDACKQSESAPCVQEDGMQALYPQVQVADVLVWATPMYWWNMSAPLKAFVDRLYALPRSCFKGKRLLLVMTTQAPPEEDGRQGLEMTLQEICLYTGMLYVGVVTAGSDPLAVSAQPAVLEAAFAHGAALRLA